MEKYIYSPAMKQNWGWILAVGIALVLLGVFAFAWPVVSTLSLVYYLGASFIAIGLIVGFQSVMFISEPGSGWHLLHAAVAVIAGILIFRYPGAGIVSVAMMLTFYFLMTAGAKAMLAYSMGSKRGTGLLYVSAACSFLLAVYILATFPVSALWVPGFIFGVDLIFYGAALIGTSFDIKHLARKFDGPVVRHA